MPFSGQLGYTRASMLRPHRLHLGQRTRPALRAGVSATVAAWFATAASCAASTPPPAEVTPAEAPDATAAVADDSSARLPLTEREAELVSELEHDVRELAGEIGERNTAEGWNLASATDTLAEKLEQAGYAVERQGFVPADDAVAQNLVVTVRGGARGDQTVVVGAHYDSAAKCPGADDNASGVAALLALARRFASKRPSRTLRFVAFATQEGPHWRNAEMGSTVYAKRLAAAGEKVVAMLSLESLGYYSDEPGSQQSAEGCSDCFGPVADYAAVLGNEASSKLVDDLVRALTVSCSLPIRGGVLPGDHSVLAAADHWAFWQVGYPAVVVTDTGPLRYAHHHRLTDTPERLDYERMARLVAGLELAISELVGCPATG